MNVAATTQLYSTGGDDRLLRTHETARLLSVSPRMIALLVKDGRLRPTRIGRCLRFDRADIDEFVRQSKGGTGDAGQSTESRR